MVLATRVMIVSLENLGGERGYEGFFCHHSPLAMTNFWSEAVNVLLLIVVILVLYILMITVVIR